MNDNTECLLLLLITFHSVSTCPLFLVAKTYMKHRQNFTSSHRYMEYRGPDPICLGLNCSQTNQQCQQLLKTLQWLSLHHFALKIYQVLPYRTRTFCPVCPNLPLSLRQKETMFVCRAIAINRADDCSASIKFLDCVEQSLTTLCGTEVAAWQRTMTTSMLVMSTTDADCMHNAPRLRLFSLLSQLNNLIQEA